MNIFWIPILRPLLKAANAKRVVEIGAEAGRNSTRLAQWCKANAAFADIIDPAPKFDTVAFEQTFAGAAKVHITPSLEVLADLPPADVVLIDGDHNWYTVFHEINLLLGPPEAPQQNPPILVLDDTGWPWGRRDSYYDPDRIPEAFRQTYAKGQIAPGSSGWDPRGIIFDIPCATTQGGARNGVLTALEDALAGREDDFEIVSVGVYSGLAIVVPKTKLGSSPELQAFLAEFRPSAALRPLLDLLENARIGGALAIEQFRSVFQFGTKASPQAQEGARPLQTELPTQVWQSVQRGMNGQKYKGRTMLLSPFDQFNYMSLIETLRPGTIFEIGTYEGGRALWMADQLRAFDIEGRIVSVDIAPPKGIADPKVDVIYGNALDLGEVLTADFLSALPRPWLVIEDAAHTEPMCLAVLEFFDAHLQPGDRIVVEDGNTGSLIGQPETSAPHMAIQTFLSRRGSDYRLDTDTCDRYGHNLTACPNGWLIRA